MSSTPSINPTDPLRDLFERASTLDAVARKELLDSLRESSPALVEEVEGLLAYHEADGILDKSPSELGSKLAADTPTVDSLAGALPQGTRIAKYVIQRVIGVGGMGVVYLAEQEFPRRSVAIKLVRSELITGPVLRRFEAEASTLALLQHPGIAQVFDAGKAVVADSQRPYIAMEFVSGEPITRYAEKSNLSTEQILRLMIDVCDAVQHAHQRGVIHRDLKPGNILVSESGQPKVLDFGIARLTGADPAATATTAMGQIVGTLGYMSPEQALGDPRALDTRSDVYSLGVILYELLCKRRPIGHDTSTVAQAIRALTDEMPRPPREFNAQFKGDIDVIVLRAIDKRIDRRYQSAAALAEDLRRHLAGQPIEARRDSATYILSTQLKRYRGAVIAASCAIAALIAFSAIAWSQARANRRLADSLVTELSNTRVERARLLGRTDSWPAGEEAMWREFIANPQSQSAHWALRELYLHIPVVGSAAERTVGFVSGATATSSALGPVTAVCTRNGFLSLWSADLRTKHWEVRVCERGPGPISMSADASRITAAVPDGFLILNGSDGKVLARTESRAGNRAHAIIAPDASRVFASVDDDVLTVFSVSDLKPVATLAIPGLDRIALSHKADTLAAANKPERDGSIVLTSIDAASLKVRATVAIPAGSAKGACRAICFTRDDSYLAVSDDASIHPVAVSEWSIKPAVAVSYSITGLAAVDQRRIAGVTSSRAIVVDLEQALIERQIPYSSGGGIWIAESSEPGTFLCSPELQFVRRFDVRAERLLAPIGKVRTSPFLRLIASQDGRACAVHNEDGELRAFARDGDGWSQRLSKRIASGVPAATFAKNDTLLLTLNGAGTLTMYSVAGETWEPAKQIRTQINPIAALAVDAEATSAVLSDRSGTLHSWSLTSEKRLAEVAFKQPATPLSFSPDASSVRVYDPNTSRMLELDPATLETRSSVLSAVRIGRYVTNPSNSHLARQSGRRVQILDPRTLASRFELAGHPDMILKTEFDAAGDHIASIGREGVLTIWNASTGVNLLRSSPELLGRTSGCALLGSVNHLAVGLRSGEIVAIDFTAIDRCIVANMDRWIAALSPTEDQLAHLQSWARNALGDPAYTLRRAVVREDGNVPVEELFSGEEREPGR